MRIRMISPSVYQIKQTVLQLSTVVRDRKSFLSVGISFYEIESDERVDDVQRFVHDAVDCASQQSLQLRDAQKKM